MSTNGACARGPNRWMSRATRPLPLPVSPWIRMRGGRDARAHASRSLSTSPRSSTIAGLSPSSSAPSVTDVPPPRSGLGAALRDRPRELADQPRIALLDDLEAVVGVLDRVLAGPLLVPDLDDALVPEEPPVRGLERHAPQLLLDPAFLPELELSVVTGDRALLDVFPNVHLDPVLARVVGPAGYGTEELRHGCAPRHPLRCRLARAQMRGPGDPYPERHCAVLEQSQAWQVRQVRGLDGRELVRDTPHVPDELLVHRRGAVVPPEGPVIDAAGAVVRARPGGFAPLADGLRPARTSGQLLFLLLAAFARGLDPD